MNADVVKAGMLSGINVLFLSKSMPLDFSALNFLTLLDAYLSILEAYRYKKLKFA